MLSSVDPAKKAIGVGVELVPNTNINVLTNPVFNPHSNRSEVSSMVERLNDEKLKLKNLDVEKLCLPKYQPSIQH
jgi:hypothetical protein